ncbi:hypothetical protein [Arthrobacter burdickii]|uniref:Secreted protein n=1 Tax=Arthrobacter burdickii TaxID=3035920 RepID=A0ABT8K368_9MICC|nr:hypothetical protein [Arthrobacter burdickii]MDN4611497.1 hypothetical protein [Arthrobacter burdickii]
MSLLLVFMLPFVLMPGADPALGTQLTGTGRDANVTASPFCQQARERLDSRAVRWLTSYRAPLDFRRESATGSYRSGFSPVDRAYSH